MFSRKPKLRESTIQHLRTRVANSMLPVQDVSFDMKKKGTRICRLGHIADSRFVFEVRTAKRRHGLRRVACYKIEMCPGELYVEPEVSLTLGESLDQMLAFFSLWLKRVEFDTLKDPIERVVACRRRLLSNPEQPFSGADLHAEMVKARGFVHEAVNQAPRESSDDVSTENLQREHEEALKWATRQHERRSKDDVTNSIWRATADLALRIIGGVAVEVILAEVGFPKCPELPGSPALPELPESIS